MRATQTLASIAIVLCTAWVTFGQSTESQVISAVVPVSNNPTNPVAPASFTSTSANPNSSVLNLSTRLASGSKSKADRSVSDQAPSVLGALMLCGGGPLPHTLMETFFEMGQAKQGTLVIIPSASSLADQGDYTWSLNQWQQFPWASVKVLHAQSRQDIETNSDFVKPLQEATAVWISGGDQRRLAERYLGTQVEHELKKVVNRGGIIGGTSAGSAIASRVMISGGRQQPVIANGMDLLPGAIIDQHFSQRKRYERLASAVQQHPDRVGIGIDESTGLVVSKKEARVLGMGSVYIYSRRETAAEQFEPLKFDSGTAFSLPEYSLRKE